MPTPDASAFTRQSKLRAYQNQARTGNVKMITHLYQPIVTTSGLLDFLPSFTNKNVSPYTRFYKYETPTLSGGNGYLNVTPVKPKYIQ